MVVTATQRLKKLEVDLTLLVTVEVEKRPVDGQFSIIQDESGVNHDSSSLKIMQITEQIIGGLNSNHDLKILLHGIF